MLRLNRNVLVLCAVVMIARMQAIAHDEVIFTSLPITVARIGVLYEYDVDAIGAEPVDSIVFELRDRPAGMRIDRLTGLIQWTPSAVGSFRVKVRAFAFRHGEERGHADQEFMLSVLAGQPSSLRGIVQSLSGQRVADVRLRLFDITRGQFVFNTKSDSVGMFNFAMVSPGNYFLRVMPDEDSPFARQWYDRAQRIQDATAIVVPESSVVTITVTLLPRQNMNFTLSGTVRDTNGLPIAGARVSIFRERQNGDGDGLNFRGLDDDDREVKLVRTVITDSMGNYSTRLRPRTYIIAAKKQGYRIQFWDHKDNPLDADRLNLVSDTSGIDFDLSPIPVFAGAIQGTISSATTLQPVRSHVLGFHRLTPNGNFTGFIRHAETDSVGRYRLAVLRPGFYVVLALPDGQYLPTFYDTSGGTTDLRRAFPVAVGNQLVEGIDIRVLPDTVDGLNRIHGSVTVGSVPLRGALVYAVSAQTNEILGVSVSTSDGRYAVVGLKPGSYRMLAVKVGFETSSSTQFVLQHTAGVPSTASVNLSLVHTTSADGPATNQPFWFALEQNFPNPFNPATTIKYSLPIDATVTLRIYSVIGQEVARLVDGAQPAGHYEVVWNGQHSNGAVLASGVYLFRLEAVPLTGGDKITRTLKLLLLK